MLPLKGKETLAKWTTDTHHSVVVGGSHTHTCYTTFAVVTMEEKITTAATSVRAQPPPSSPFPLQSDRRREFHGTRYRSYHRRAPRCKHHHLLRHRRSSGGDDNVIRADITYAYIFTYTVHTYICHYIDFTSRLRVCVCFDLRLLRIALYTKMLNQGSNGKKNSVRTLNNTCSRWHMAYSRVKKKKRVTPSPHAHRRCLN